MNVKLVPRWQDKLAAWIEHANISNKDFLRSYERVLSKWGNILDLALKDDHSALKTVCSACNFCNRTDNCEECVVTVLTGKRCTEWFPVVRIRHVWALRDHEEIATAAARVLGALAYFYGQVVEVLSEEEQCT